MASKKQRAPKTKGKRSFQALASEGEDNELVLSRLALSPSLRHASTASTFAAPMFGDSHETAFENDVKVLKEAIAKAGQGDKAFASELLAAQAVSLDAIFTELARRSAVNAGSHLHATERYMRLALKAQSNCRATLDALAKLHQPREQTVKHVQVNEGGQAVVADQFHQHGGQNEKSGKQSHATGTTGKGSEMLGQDAEGNGVPVSSREGAQSVPDARRDKPRRA